MKIFHILPAIMLPCLMATSVHADLLPPDVWEAQNRLHEHPGIFDRTDQYCTKKQPGDPCTIPGTTFSGGGEGACEQKVHGSSIDLTCIRSEQMYIDRQLPEGGFVADETVCGHYKGEIDGRRYNCTPLPQPPRDRFCKEREPGQPCTAEIVYRGKTEEQAGACQLFTERQSFYAYGRHWETREVLRCEPPALPETVYTPVPWYKKLFR